MNNLDFKNFSYFIWQVSALPFLISIFVTSSMTPRALRKSERKGEALFKFNVSIKLAVMTLLASEYTRNTATKICWNDDEHLSHTQRHLAQQPTTTYPDKHKEHQLGASININHQKKNSDRPRDCPHPAKLTNCHPNNTAIQQK